MTIGNVVTTSDINKKEYPLISRLDDSFLLIVRNLINPDAIVEAVMLMRTHSSCRAASFLAMAGLNPEAFVQMRNCLETSLYALHMNLNKGFDELWLRRHDDDKSLKSVKTEFQISKTFDSLRSVDPKNEKVARKLYERTIDFGAHPNERATTSSLTIEDIEDGKKLQQTYLAPATLQQSHSMKSTAQVGLCVLYNFRQIFREKYDILGVTHTLDEIRNVL